MFDWLTHQISDSPVTYLVAFIAAGGDVLLPLIPSETIVITAGVVASRGGLSLWLLIPATAAGALVGDHLAYVLGRRVGDPLVHRVVRGDAAQARLRWATRATARHGPTVIVVGRFIPGGRTVTTLAAGSLGMPWRTFATADVPAAVLWALYATMLGYLGGTAFEDSSWKPLVLALGLAGALSTAVELWRRHQRRRGRDLLGDPLDRRERSG